VRDTLALAPPGFINLTPAALNKSVAAAITVPAGRNPHCLDAVGLSLTWVSSDRQQHSRACYSDKLRLASESRTLNDVLQQFRMKMIGMSPGAMDCGTWKFT